MVLATRKSGATYQDVLDLPEGVTGQIIDGELVAHARPASPHAWIASRLGFLLGTPFDRGAGGPGGWHIIHEPELHLGPRPDILVPDLAGWRRERMPRRPTTPFITLAPDWACEVSSTSTAGFDRVRKMPIYAREGVRHVWIVDPTSHTIEVFRAEAEGWLFVRAVLDEAEAALEPFDAVPLDLTYLWSE
jgi:Uma2 family endonuclease